MPTKYDIHVVSNTHWDREWVYPSAETRLLLVEFMDNLLKLLDDKPDFNSFLMDSQTLCVEDYLEWRPEKRETVEKHVKDGRLVVGPWYSLPEEYIVNGESLVRNLVVGHIVAEGYGKVSKLGYTPFSYGQTSQMPQIYQGFDIDTIIFYRGIITEKSEFIMRGPDGSEVIGTRFGAVSRFSYFFYIYRMVAYNMTRDDWEYRWDRGALPFRLVGDHHGHNTHYYVTDPDATGWHAEHIEPGLKKLISEESEHFSTKHMVCMQGFDSSEPDPREIDLIKLCQEALGDDHNIFQSDLATYMDIIKKAVKDGEIEPEVIEGESRNPGATGKWTHLYGDIISSRVTLKIANHKTENALQRLAEPFQSISWMLGNPYPSVILGKLWRELLKNHPHDTICGAGNDQMEKDAIHRFEQIQITSHGLMRRGMQAIQKEIDNSDLAADEVALTVFNPSPFERSEVVNVSIDLPSGSEIDHFEIVDMDGKPVEKQEVGRYPWGTLVRNLRDISLQLRSQRVSCHFMASYVPALGYKTYHLKPKELVEKPMVSMVPAPNQMENEHLHVVFNSDGTLDVTHKATKKTYEGLHYLEDSGEAGHAWMHREPDQNQTITSHGEAKSIALVKDGPLMVQYAIEYRMMIPEGLEYQHWFPEGGQKADQQTVDRSFTKRSVVKKEMVVTSTFTLRKDSRQIEVTTSVDNQCQNHRLRVCYPTGIKADKVASEAAFDVIERPIFRDEKSVYWGKESPVLPHYRFLDVSDGKVGLALINEGIREYEAFEDESRTIAITLLRAVIFRQSPVIDQWDVFPDETLSQSPGVHTWRYAICPHKGDWADANVFEQADIQNLPLEVAQVGSHKGSLPKEHSFLKIEPTNLVMTAMKKAEDRDSLIVRLFNPTSDNIDGQITLHTQIKTAALCNLNEEVRQELSPSGDTVKLSVGPKKIITLDFTC